VTELAQDEEGQNLVFTNGNVVDVGQSEPAVVQYYFPVEIVLEGGISRTERAALEAGVWEKLNSAVERIG